LHTEINHTTHGTHARAQRARASTRAALAPVSGLASALVLALCALAAAQALAGSGGLERVLEWLTFAFAASVVVLLVRERRRLASSRAHLAELADTLEETTRREPLTGLLNQAALSEHLVRAAAHARRRVEPLSLVLLDIRGMHDINTRHGRTEGDAVLRAFAECMRSTLRADDVYGRLEDDEFLVLLPATIGVQAEIVAERLCALAASIELPCESGDVGGVELNVACATAVRATPDGIMEQARSKLHRAKASRATRDAAQA